MKVSFSLKRRNEDKIICFTSKKNLMKFITHCFQQISVFTLEKSFFVHYNSLRIQQVKKKTLVKHFKSPFSSTVNDAKCKSQPLKRKTLENHFNETKDFFPRTEVS